MALDFIIELFYSPSARLSAFQRILDISETAGGISVVRLRPVSPGTQRADQYTPFYVTGACTYGAASSFPISSSCCCCGLLSTGIFEVCLVHTQSCTVYIDAAMGIDVLLSLMHSHKGLCTATKSFTMHRHGVAGRKHNLLYRCGVIGGARRMGRLGCPVEFYSKFEAVNSTTQCKVTMAHSF